MAQGHGSGGDGGDVRLHVAMFPFFAFGHICPFVQLSTKLAAHGVKVSFLSAPANVPRISSLLSSAIGGAGAAAVDIVPLQVPTVEGLPPGIQSTAEENPIVGEFLKQAIDLMKPQVESILADLRPHAIFHDFTFQWLPSIAHPLGVKTVLFSVFGAVALAYFNAPARRLSADNLTSPPVGFPTPPHTTIDGIPAHLQASCFSYIFQTFYGMPSGYDRMVSCLRESSAVVIRTCREMEAPFLDFLEAQYKKPMLPAGPIMPDPPRGELEERWATWLDGFPAGSVIYCGFGSESFLTDEGIMELALGLELTGMPFLLVINFPRDDGDEEDGPMRKLRSSLPEGFEERVWRRGAVHSGWMQQQHVLAHPSVGCFLCHAGLSSLVEGVAHGCQLVLLPQKNDQFLNAKLFSGDLRAAVVVPRREEDGGFTRDDVRESVIKVMARAEEEPGKTVRENHRRWREFLLEADRRYTAELVRKVREMAAVRSDEVNNL